VRKHNRQDYPDWRKTCSSAQARRTSGSRNNPESLIDGGAITESAKHIYRHTLKNHVRDT
jgi:hypothetical protein